MPGDWVSLLIPDPLAELRISQIPGTLGDISCSALESKNLAMNGGAGMV